MQPVLTDSLLNTLYQATNNFSLGLNYDLILNNDNDEFEEKASRIFHY
ncbi:10559_t:CDS:1, partial [Racocetra fulgida]